MAELALIASQGTGRTISHRTIRDDEWRSAKVAAGMPEVYADMLLGTFRAARRGDFAATDPALEAVLGRAPLAIRDVIAGAMWKQAWPERSGRLAATREPGQPPRSGKPLIIAEQRHLG